MTKPHLEHSIFGADEHAHGGLPQDEHADTQEVDPRHQRRAARRRKLRKGGRGFVLLTALAVVAVAVAAAYTVLRPVVDGLLESKDYPGPGSGEVTVTIKEGDYPPAMGKALAQAGVVKTREAFVDAAAAESRTTSIQPGTYTFKKEMTAKDALAVLIDPANRAQVPRVTIREGLWVAETYALLSKGTGVPLADYQAAAKNPAALGLPAAAEGNLEGWLFPSSYEFKKGLPAADQLKQMVAMTVTELDKAGVAEQNYQRTLTVASIVEGEVSGHADRGKVARVVENRLRTTGAPNYGLLQMDSTVHFAVQKRGRAGTSDADRASASPYNTYRAKGLPPGPINSPGAASVEAAANPEPGSWLYFVTVNPTTGETRFAATQGEHDQNVQVFQQWCRDNADKC